MHAYGFFRYAVIQFLAVRAWVAGKASSNMLTAGAAAPAVKPPAPAVESKLWHCGGQTVSSYLLKRSFSRCRTNNEVESLQFLVN